MSEKRDEKDSMAHAALMAVTPIDGRYRARTRALAQYFSEYALIRYRLRAEIEWYAGLAANPSFDAMRPLAPATAERLRALYREFPADDAARVKELEAETNHDVKALEYYLKEKFAAIDPALPVELIHFACTSEDISNLAWALMHKEFVAEHLLPALEQIAARIGAMARAYAGVPMLARTHGQEASPTTVGKELAIFAYRLNRQIGRLRSQEYLGKANGAVGNFNAHRAAAPEVDWIDHSRRFVEALGLTWNPLTTQIESHDFLAELYDVVARISVILIDFCRDVWGYVSLGYFGQKTVAGEVGSSVMPHKINPIDFENAEGNLGLAIAMFQHLAAKLPISRWQRDLSDSTAMRAIGTAFGHVTVALASLERGIGKLTLNRERIAADLENDKAWEVLAEGIQTVMRRHGLERPYERLKELTRGRAAGRDAIREFVAGLALPPAARAELLALEPKNYLGFARELAERFAPEGKK